MSGIMAAVAGTTRPNIIFGAGLFNTTTGVDLSPITASATNVGTITRTWIGYFLPASTATVSLSLQTTRNQGTNAFASTVGRLWLGSNAVSGFTDGNANITATNSQTSSVNFAMTQGVYYPVRIRWDGEYFEGGGFFGGNASGSITFLASSSSSVSGRIFYNTLTNGF
jgi:hypothetical protein